MFYPFHSGTISPCKCKMEPKSLLPLVTTSEAKNTASLNTSNMWPWGTSPSQTRRQTLPGKEKESVLVWVGEQMKTNDYHWL